MGGDAVAHHGCQVQTINGDDLVSCGVPGEWWEAPSGRSFYVCTEHRAHLADPDREAPHAGDEMNGRLLYEVRSTPDSAPWWRLPASSKAYWQDVAERFLALTRDDAVLAMPTVKPGASDDG